MMRIWVYKLIVFCLFFAFCFSVFARLAGATGAPIPPRFGGYYPPPVVRSNCLLTYDHRKRFSCDRIFRGVFQ